MPDRPLSSETCAAISPGPTVMQCMFQIAGGSVGLGLTTTVLFESSEGGGPDAFVDGLEAAFRLDALLAVGGFLISVLLIGGRPHLTTRWTAGHSPRGHGP